MPPTNVVLIREQGFIQFDVGDEEDAGRLGTVARREKDVREREHRHLTGQAGKDLYLECLQLILRNQLSWLITQKGHREELETVVRDLWDLRTRGSSSHSPEDTANDNTSAGGLQMFSSQPTDKEEGAKHGMSKSRSQTWEPEQGPNWPMPRMLDTLVLCYLGCLLLKIPTRVGELGQWANAGHLPYRRVVR